MAISEMTYHQIALEDPDGQWELHCGRLRQKPTMSVEHNYVNVRLLRLLVQQLDEHAYDVRANMGRVQRASVSYFIPDVYVVPMELVQQRRRDQPNALEAYEVSLPLVVEIWSPSTGDYDVETKLLEYQRRGDHEIWRIHPYDRTLTAWCRQPDGTYTETHDTQGIIRPASLPGVSIDLTALFA